MESYPLCSIAKLSELNGSNYDSYNLSHLYDLFTFQSSQLNNDEAETMMTAARAAEGM